MGDVSRTQIDIAHRGPNPLAEVVRRILKKGGHADVGVVQLTRKDILRDGIVQWLDEVLGDDAELTPEPVTTPKSQLVLPEEAKSTWYQIKCVGCKSRLWYDNRNENEADHEDVAAVQCWACQKVVTLWDETGAFSPNDHIAPDGPVQESFPVKP